MTTVGAVAIGRNEGARLRRCLTTLAPQVERLVYVDSGSTDDSVAFARGLAVTVVELDTATPFTAARARNAGFEALRDGGLPDLVQFVDGDCGVEPGWIDAARAALEADPGVAVVTGWRTEIDPDASIYNAMCEVEWHRPAGEIRSCGGDMIIRSAVFDAVGGFNPRIIASEDEELVLRIRATGHRAIRLPRIMTRHDAAMTRFSQWWQRAVRTGHGFAEVGGLHPDHFVRERQRVWFYAAALPVLLLAGLVLRWETWIGLVAALFLLSWASATRGLIRAGLPPRMAMRQAVYLTIAKFPNLQGMLTYYWRRWRGADMKIIEYK